VRLYNADVDYARLYSADVDYARLYSADVDYARLYNTAGRVTQFAPLLSSLFAVPC
jgi:uncharacterized protein YjbI with pentapeptide repeats